MLNPIHTEQLPNQFSFDLILVEGGTFLMGGQAGREITVSSFYIGKHPVTQALWQAVMGAGNNPSFFRGDNRPVERVSWDDTQEFFKKLNGLTSKSYRLLTEAEWEYAARGGQKSRGFEYAGGSKLKELGWYDENSYGETKAVGLKRPNELGVYDMSGNVWEWVEDQWHDNYEGAPRDGSAWVDREPGVYRVIRGGGWGNDAGSCRVSYRTFSDPSYRNYDVGFRLGLSLQSAG